MNFFPFLKPKKENVFSSKINDKIRVIENFSRKVIYVAGAEQTGGTITGMWQKALLLIKNQWIDAKNMLLLGLGGGDVIRLIRKTNPNIHIKAIDLDPVMIEIAGKFFDLKKSSDLTIVKRDAFYYLLLNRKKYHFIVVDLFVGFKNPVKFRSLKFLKMLKTSLAPGGTILYNSHYHSYYDREFDKFHQKCVKIFSLVEIVISYPYSKILLLKP